MCKQLLEEKKNPSKVLNIVFLRATTSFTYDYRCNVVVACHSGRRHVGKFCQSCWWIYTELIQAVILEFSQLLNKKDSEVENV